jgi:transcriptional regulator with XRE-family HTH domain
MAYGKTDRCFLRDLGMRIRRCRTVRGWTQEQFAFESGLHRNYIGSVERGERNVSVLNLRKMADALGASVRDLVPRETGPGARDK